MLELRMDELGEHKVSEATVRLAVVLEATGARVNMFENASYIIYKQ